MAGPPFPFGLSVAELVEVLTRVRIVPPPSPAVLRAEARLREHRAQWLHLLGDHGRMTRQRRRAAARRAAK